MARPWSPAATVVLALFVMGLFIFAQVVVVIAWFFVSGGDAGTPEEFQRELERLSADGDVVSAARLAGAVVCVAALAVLARGRGVPAADYLALGAVPPRTMARWLAWVALFAAASDALSWLVGQPIVPAFMEQTYRSADYPLVLWLALVIVAPLFEELLFRGFLIAGLAPTRLGPAGAVVVAALAWGAIHQQYDLYGIATITVLGLLFGAARVRTGSTLVPMAMHVLANMVATIEAALCTGGFAFVCGN